MMRTLTMEEVADRLGVSCTSVCRYARLYPDFPVVKLTRQTWRVPEDRLEAWLASRIGQEPTPQTVTEGVRRQSPLTLDDLDAFAPR